VNSRYQKIQSGLTVRQAREIVKNELAETRRWEDGIHEEEEEKN
jgi:hypothetical protein